MPIGNQVNSSIVRWFARNRAHDSSIKDVAPERQLQLLEAGEPTFREIMKFEGDFQVLRGREGISLGQENKVVMLNVPQALGIAQTCG